MAKQAAGIRKLARRDLDALSEGLVWQDEQGRIIDANAAAAPILGLTLDELLGRTPHDPRWYAVHEDGSPWPGQDHPGMVALRTGLPQRNRLMGIMAPNAGRRWIRIDATPQRKPGVSAPVGVLASFVDVTDEIERRHRLEEQIRGQASADNVGLMLLSRRRIVWCNASAGSMLGYSPEELAGQSSRPHFPDKVTFDAFGKAVGEALRRTGHFGGIVLQRTKGGATRSIRFDISRFGDEPRTWIAAMSDVALVRADPTASMEAAEQVASTTGRPTALMATDASGLIQPSDAAIALKQLQSHLERVQSVARVGSFALGSDPDEFTYTRETARLFDLNEQGQTNFAEWFSRVHPDDRTMVQTAWEAALQGTPYDVTYRIVARDRVAWIRARADLEFDAAGRLKNAVGTLQDITDLKAVEFELERSKQRLQLAVEASALGTWDYDLRTGQVDRDARFLGMIGYAPGELESDYDSFTRIVHPDDLADVQVAALAHFRGETAVYESEHRLRHKDGHYVWVLSVGKVVERDASSQPLRIMGTNRDISQHKRLAEGSIDLLRHIEKLIAATSPARQAVSASPPAATSHARLTQRERQIAGLIAAGLTSAEIGEQLHLAVPTIVSHRRNLMAKLKLHSTAEVTRYAIEQGLLKTD